MNDLYPIFTLLIPVHVGRESCGGIKTRLAERWRKQWSIKLDVAPSEADRLTALSLGLTPKAATPIAMAVPSSACSPTSDKT